MIKNYEKIIFLLVVIGAIFFARAMYPTISGIPSLASTEPPQTAIALSTSAPPTLVLPQTSVSSADSGALVSGGDTASVPASSSETMADVNTVFSKVNNTQPPSLNDEAYMVADLTTSAVLAGSNVVTRWPTASLTKLMTATLVFDQLATSTTITITPQMFAADPTEQTLVIGGTYTVEDLLHVMLMPSSNVAAEAMADFIGRTQFMNEMNARAQAWGMTDTYFSDPSGISAANESTANDLLILAQHVYNNYPGILAITDTHQTTITELNSDKKITVTSINDFAGEPNFVGGKTGHTDQASGNLLSIFNYDSHPVLIIVLGTVDRFGDTSKLYAWFRANYK
ncbi:MAG TPA: serine hydrolase [Candidatus Paceibacterota bacterium]|nr:serine hydrolase [Candidatus Paceibacterota bacterium]